eukprot:CAMPEP_0116080942 /NCGR_PEP_ID=MMETSP0327-20121206/1940_1 /TAXON_ID=44447 /ORGANISM="Pseudo-nitzschia delicatissima, Strain B596" /LENGTH=226 /DNA_ID=CAMNT_0003571659 /DNA_START=62 /DNA_END=742 /DNA_ORIENTATION=+
MDHPVEDINASAKYILGGDYGTSIFLLTKALKKIKLIISGDAKVATPAEPESIETFAPRDLQRSGCIENKQEDRDRFKSSGDAFEYGFFDMAAENFLNTSVPMQEGGFCKFRRVSVFETPLTVKGDLFGVSLDTPLCHDLSCVVMYNLALSHQLQAIALFKFAEENGELASHYLIETGDELVSALSANVQKPFYTGSRSGPPLHGTNKQSRPDSSPKWRLSKGTGV